MIAYRARPFHQVREFDSAFGFCDQQSCASGFARVPAWQVDLDHGGTQILNGLFRDLQSGQDFRFAIDLTELFWDAEDQPGQIGTVRAFVPVVWNTFCCASVPIRPNRRGSLNTTGEWTLLVTANDCRLAIFVM